MPGSCNVVKSDEGVVVLSWWYLYLFSVLVGPISHEERSGDDLLNALVQDGERVERLDRVV